MRKKQRNGYTMIEVAMSTFVMAVLLIAAMNVAGSSIKSQHDNSTNSRSNLIAKSLMSEIVNRPFEDLNQTPGFGLESGESSSNRSAFDDVDDYNGWSKAPPEDASGTALANASGLTRTVTVFKAAPSNLTVAANNGPVKVIKVKVLRDAEVVAELVTAVSK